MPLDLIVEKSTLVQVMAWCCQATSHYLSQCWPRPMSPYGVTRPQWVNLFQLSSHSPAVTRPLSIKYLHLNLFQLNHGIGWRLWRGFWRGRPRHSLGHPLVPGTNIHRMAHRILPRMALYFLDALRRLLRTYEGHRRGPAQDRTAAIHMGLQHGQPETYVLMLVLLRQLSNVYMC